MMIWYSLTILNKVAFELKTFTALSIDELYQILQLRCAVFVLEQTCPYQDLDGLDQQSLHMFQQSESGEVFAYARILAPGLSYANHISIGRVVVSEEKRKDQIGQALMQAAIEAALDSYPGHSIKISAQTYLTRFYQNLGFVSTGKYYLEDQIPHQEMLFHPHKKWTNDNWVDIRMRLEYNHSVYQ